MLLKNICQYRSITRITFNVCYNFYCVNKREIEWQCFHAKLFSERKKYVYEFESDLIFVIFLKFHCIWMCGKWLLLFRICFLPVYTKERKSLRWLFYIYSTELNLFLCNDKSNVRLPDCTRKTKNAPELWYLSFIIDQQA